jgi:predicted ATPase
LLDNCEHLVDACASLADAVARGCPRVWALATSRESLGVAGEVIVPMEGLELPDRAQRGREHWLEGSEAGRLFIDRATRAGPGFFVDDAGAAAIAQICERLDGIPLAIELAAARARPMSVEAIAEGVSDRFSLLAGRARSGPPRHRTLLASIKWSCGAVAELVSDKELRMPVEAEFPLERAREALEGVGGRHTRGRVVLQIGE